MDKYVPHPNKKAIQGDLLIGLKRFKNTCRWREFFKKRQEDEDKMNPRGVEEFKFDINDSLGTGLKLARSKTFPKGLGTLEAFLQDVERKLLVQAFSGTIKDPKTRDATIKDLLNQQAESEEVVSQPTKQML